MPVAAARPCLKTRAATGTVLNFGARSAAALEVWYIERVIC